MCADVATEGSFHRSVLPPETGDGPEVVIEPRNTLNRLGLPEVWAYRHLLWFFVLRSLRGRYRPTVLGYGWIIARPLLISLVYVVVFGYLCALKTHSVPYPLFVLFGIVVYLCASNFSMGDLRRRS